jgi:hypothetical protein
MKLNVAGSLRGHVVGPLDTHIIVVVEDNGGVEVRNDITGIIDTVRKIAKINNLFRGGTGSSDLSFTGTEGSAFLSFTKPTNWTAVLEDDATIHTSAEFKEGEKSAIRDRAANLGAPTSVPIGGNGVR